MRARKGCRDRLVVNNYNFISLKYGVRIEEVLNKLGKDKRQLSVRG